MYQIDIMLVAVILKYAAYLGMKFIVAQIERGIDRFERLEVDVHSLLLAIVG